MSAIAMEEAMQEARLVREQRDRLLEERAKKKVCRALLVVPARRSWHPRSFGMARVHALKLVKYTRRLRAWAGALGGGAAEGTRLSEAYEGDPRDAPASIWWGHADPP